MDEIWLPVVSFELYEVSTHGRVRRRGRVLRPAANGSGHLLVNLSCGGVCTSRLVHRLVLEAFVGPCPPGHECRHYPDRTPGNNHLGNLSWATRKINMADKIFHGTAERCYGRARGLRYNRHNTANSKITTAQVKKMRWLYDCKKYTVRTLADLFDLPIRKCREIVKRRTWAWVE